MQVLYLSPELLSIGGMQRQNRLMVAALDRYARARGGSVSVLCLNDQPPPQLPPEMTGLEATRFHFFSRRRGAFLWALTASLPEAMLVIYGLLGFAPLALLQGTFNRKARGILQLHGREAWRYRGGLHDWSLGRLDAVLSVSHYTLETFRSLYPRARGLRGYVLPNSVSPELMRRAESASGSAVPRGQRLLTVSRLDSTDLAKGIDTVLYALAKLREAFPNLVLHVVGDGFDRSRLETLATQLQVSDSVRFLGPLPDDKLAEEYARCTLFVLPSAKEGFGLVFIEAMAFGKPVVAAKATATPEVVQDGQHGLLIDYGNADQAAEAISTLLRDHRLRQVMGEAGRQTVREKFTFDVFCDRLFGLLDSIACG